ncbi:hypothetical protein ARMGADRAFT_1026419 [Armillaria gallica]|uniref:Uncharacterized protein n=1 Tax=Armillaria gallica TaxID=47427 RepID=A0A2H3E5I6_ARMGA|nr:hypothetical protein ARMGADRAFT_1026419 [Armillaria gallica]
MLEDGCGVVREDGRSLRRLGSTVRVLVACSKVSQNSGNLSVVGICEVLTVVQRTLEKWYWRIAAVVIVHPRDIKVKLHSDGTTRERCGQEERRSRVTVGCARTKYGQVAGKRGEHRD